MPSNDEFNYVKITNEENGESLEFGETPQDESASFSDNSDNIRDEVNDNNPSNNENQSPEEQKKRESKENKSKEDGGDKSSKSSSSSSSSSGMAGIASVVGSALVAIPVLSTLVGINLFLRATCRMKNMDVMETSLKYELELSDTDNANYVISLENETYEQVQELVEGDNEGYFVDLSPNTTYTLSVTDISDKSVELYSEIVKTLAASGSVIISFDAGNRSGAMNPLELEVNSEYTLPVSIFVPNDDEYFGGWKVNGEGEILQPGDTIVVGNDTTLVAEWTKFPTQENTVTADNNFFSRFPEQPSTVVSSVTIMNVEFQYSTVAYSSNEETLGMYVYDAFVSTTTPFAGPIKSITVNSKTTNYDLNMVYSASPIYERVTEGGETKTIEFAQDYTFECTNPDARYFCLSRDNDSSHDVSFTSMEFVYNTPVIENEFLVYFDANGGTGSFGPYRVSNTNKESLPDISTIGFVAPEGYEFAGWKLSGVDDILQPGTVVGISSDITLVAQWKEKAKALVNYDANGGTGDMESGTTTGDYVFPDCEFTAPEYYLFDYWTYRIGDGDPTGDEYQPGDDKSFEVVDDQGNPNTITIIACWRPDADLSMYINYIDTLSASPTNQISFKYIKNDEHSLYTSYSLELRGESTVSVDINSLDDAESYQTATVEIDSEQVSALGSGIVDYTMNGITANGKSYDLATGSLSMAKTQKDYWLSAYIGGIALQEDNTGITFPVMKIGTEGGGSSSSSYYIPLRLDYCDFNKSHGSSDWRLVYSVDGTTETNTTFTYSGGTANVSISSSLFDADTMQATFARIYFKDQYQNQIGGVYQNVTLQASDDRNVIGFQLASSYLVNPTSTPRIRLSACGERGANPDNLYENYTFTTLGVTDDSFAATLTFRLHSKDGVVKQYVIDIADALKSKATSSMTTTNVDFDFIDVNTGVDKHEEFVEQSKRYLTDVVLTITPASGTPFTCTSYESYSFR